MPGIYIHIPFCKQACHYCNFHFSTSLKFKDDFVEALIGEIEIQKDYLNDSNGARPALDSIYFGGGTPSLLSKEEVVRIINTIQHFFEIKPDAEITLEANPDDLSKEKLLGLKSTPINRLSIGVQSFFDEDLKFMNRVHSAKEAIESLKMAQDIGFDNLTIDLIYGTPTLSNERWKQNLEKAFELNIPHLSCYCLTVEEKTALADMVKKQKAPDVDEDKSAEQFEILLEEIKSHGYEQYEISNFCRNGHYSRHNSNYWHKEKYLGLGPSAHSYNGISRQWNVSNNVTYIQSIAAGKVPFELEELNENQRFNEYILTSLRTIWGTDLKRIEADFGVKVFNEFIYELQPFITDQKIIRKADHIYLTDEGKLLADKITSDLFRG